MQEDYTILPKLKGKTDGSLKELQPVQFFTNFYNISIELKT